MKRTLAVVAITLGLTSEGAEAVSPWPAAEKQAAIDGCRMNIIMQAERDYQSRHGIKELPPRFRERMTSQIEPYLAPCNCIFDQLEKTWDFQYFISHQQEASSRAAQLMAGVCAVTPR